MRKALPCALGIALSAAFLCFALRHGLEISAPDAEGDFPGWQYTATRWGLVAAASVLGLTGAVWAFRRARPLEGEGLLVVVPAVLVGLLLSAAPAAAARPAEEWASRHTAAYAASEREARDWEAENRLRPVPVPMHSSPPPTSALLSRVPSVGELGAGWYDNQRPSVVGPRDGRPGAEVRFVKASRTTDGWDFDRTLRVTVKDYPTLADATRAAAPTDGGYPAAATTSGVRWRLRPFTGGGCIALAQRGTLVWSVWLSDGQPELGAIPVAERDALLALVATHVRTA